MGCYRFGAFELDLTTFRLKRDDQPVPLQPKVFDVLLRLIERRGEIVTKAELLDAFWPGEHINEGAISWCISHLRRALGQERGSRHPIETVSRRGYRFTAEVSMHARARPSARPEAHTPATSTFVGRAGVMAELAQKLEAAVAGRGGLVVLTGEAGIGKTRCVLELSSRAEALGAQAWFGRCPQEAGAPPLWPIANAFRGAVATPAASAMLASISAAGAGGQSAPPAEAEGVEQFELVTRVGEALRALAAERPALLALDDLQWADEATLALLAFIAPELGESRLCIVATLRSGEIVPGGAREQALGRVLRHAQSIPLGALDAEQVAALVEILGGHRPSPELADAVQRAASGVPLFVEEVVRSLVREHGQAALAQLSPPAVRVPALARDLLRERIDRLPAPTIALLSNAAVIGDSFDLSLLAALVELEPDELLDRIDPALLEGQVQSDAAHRYRFAHSLFRSVLYDDLPPPQRVAIHRKLGQLLLEQPADQRRPAEVARHFYLSLPAGDAPLVSAHARAAAEAALRVYAHEEAVVCYEWALQAQSFSGTVEPATRAELLLQLAAAERLAGRTNDALETTARVIELAQPNRLHALVVRAALLRRPTVAMSMVPDALSRTALEALLGQLPDEPSATRVSALAQLSCMPPYTGDLARSKALSSRALALAEQLDEREPMFEAMRARLFSLSGPDDIDALLKLTDDLIELDERGRPTRYVGEALTARRLAYLLAGRIADSDAVLQRQLDAVRGRPMPEARFFCERLAAQRLLLDGKLEEADARWKVLYKEAVRAGVSYADMFLNSHRILLATERDGPRAVAQPRAMSSTWMTPQTRVAVARRAAEAGEHELARKHLAAVGDASSLPRDAHYLNVLANLAACASALDDQPRCEQLVGLLEPYAALNTPSQMGYYVGCVAHFLGMLCAALERSARAAEHFEHALERNRGMGYHGLSPGRRAHPASPRPARRASGPGQSRPRALGPSPRRGGRDRHALRGGRSRRGARACGLTDAGTPRCASSRRAKPPQTPSCETLLLPGVFGASAVIATVFRAGLDRQAGSLRGICRATRVGVLAKPKRLLRELRSYPVGRRFQTVHQRQKDAPVWVKGLVIGGAVLCLAIGIVLTLIPGPAFVFFGLAGALLAVESRGVARVLDRAEVKARKLLARFRRWRGKPGRRTTRPT